MRKTEVYSMDIDQKLKSTYLKSKILELEKDFKNQICSEKFDLIFVLWNWFVPYEIDFCERKQIPTKARPCQMNSDYLELHKK